MQGPWLTKTLAVREKRVVVTKDLLNGQPTAVVRLADRHIRRFGEAEAEVHEVPQEAHEHPTLSRQNLLVQRPSELGFVINCEIRDLRLLKGHKYCLLGQLSSEVG
ncbi:hypothetical protein ACFX13_036274 [Malus domestica]|uniref:Uncharacterized protein n=1 Tax=Malus domestica TaxID=3750 RepID=A0A498JSA8_MALDO|nr:hypothetical protein DVH24_010400 [Malus domestica]